MGASWSRNQQSVSPLPLACDQLECFANGRHRELCLLCRNTYTALNALAGHFNSFGTTGDLPALHRTSDKNRGPALLQSLSCVR